MNPTPQTPQPPADSPERMRLQKWLALCGIGSRRSCEDLIQKGRISVNGRIVTQMGTIVDPATDVVAMDGRRVTPPRTDLPRVWAFYKPIGVTSTLSDPHAERTLRDLLPGPLRQEMRRLIPIGRLDRDSEGLLLLTDNGDLALRLTHPRFQVEKEYEVWVAPPIHPDVLQTWEEGIQIPSVEEETSQGETVLVHAKARSRGTGRTPEGRLYQKISLLLREGRKRQIRRMIREARSHVLRLRRVRMGSVDLGSMVPGEWKPVEGDMLSRLEATANKKLPKARKPRRSDRGE